ncbi:MAG TPA: transposase [Iamia sp.]|jgi:REP element-mobilizing transposase RayT|nr:transposase [Iamia sp.]
MGRPHRRGSETGIHHVMNRGVDHQPIFFADDDRKELGRRLTAIHDAFSVTTLAYCLMGNHLHLALCAPDGVLPDAMHHLTSVYSRHLNDRLGRDGPLFRGRYHSIPVESDSYLLWLTRYVHRNPLDIAGVTSPRDYRWSSYRSYLGLRPAPRFLDRQPVLDLVGGRIDELAAITEDRAPIRPRTVSDLVGLVRCARAVEDLTESAPGDRPEANIDRTLLVLLAARTDDPSLARLIEAALGPRPTKAARQAARRAEGRRCDDPVVSRALRWIELQLSGAT